MRGKLCIAWRTPEDETIIKRFTWGLAKNDKEARALIGRWGVNYTLTQDREYEALLARMRERAGRA